ncbi:MAG: ATP-binding protein [Promethearchaeota archaeon]
MEYEKLWIGYEKQKASGVKNFEFDPKLLVKHFGIFGSTGSGKTVLGKILIEEMSLMGVPSIVIDPQGDLASMFIRNDDDILKSKNLNLTLVDKFYDETEIRIFTPSSNKAIPISMNPVIFPPFDIDEIEVIRILDNVASTLVEMLINLVKYPSSKSIQAKSVIYSNLFDCWSQKIKINDLNTLTEIISDDVEFYPKFMKDQDKEKLLIAMNNLLIGSTGLLFRGKAKLSFDILLNKRNGKTPVNIFLLKTLLNENERHLFVSILIQALYSWMIQQGSTPHLKCLFYMDEIAPYMPAGMRAPPAKSILLLLLRQARKYGICCGLATQSPKDIDYHGIDQINSCFFGRIISEQSKKVIKNLLLAKLSEEIVEQILSDLPALTTGNFIAFLPDLKDQQNIRKFSTRWLFSKHITLTEEDLKNKYICEPLDFEEIDQEQKQEEEAEVDVVKGEDDSEDSFPMVDESKAESIDIDIINDDDVYVFGELNDDLMEDVIKRTVNYEFFEYINDETKIEEYLDLDILDNRILIPIKEFMEKNNFSPVFSGISSNGLLVIIFQGDYLAIAIAAMKTFVLTKLGVLCSFTNKNMRSLAKKLTSAIVNIIRKKQR